MDWYAVNTLDDALDEARTLLLPFSVPVWLRLAVISLFAGGAVGVRNPSLSVNAVPSIGVRGALDYAPRLALLVIGALALSVVFGLVGSVLEFVLVRSLRTRLVRLRAPFAASVGRGLRLFTFRVTLLVVVLLPVALLAVLLLAAFATDSLLLVMGGLLLVPVVLLFAVGAAVANAATSAFVVPLMEDRNCGVLDGWRAFWPVLRQELAQFGVYAVVRFALGILVAVATSVVAGAFAIPVALAMGGLALGGDVSVLAFGAVAILAVLGALTLLVAVRVPVVTYLRYHSLLVLDASGAEFSLRETSLSEE